MLRSGTVLSTKSYYVPELDGLRAIAVLLVVTVHMHTRALAVLNGALAVHVFFVLSGYLITALALREERAEGKVDLRAFYIRRTFRIFPLYYVVLALHYALIVGIGLTPGKRDMMVQSLPYYLTYMQELFIFPGESLGVQIPFSQCWSLGIEEKFYLAWPALLFIGLRGERYLRLPVTVALATTLAFGGPYLAPYSPILIGCVVAMLLDKEPVRQRLKRTPAAVAFAMYAGFTALHLLLMPLLRNQAWTALYAVVGAVCLLLLLTVPTWVNKALRPGFLLLVGKVSYGIYLIHRLILVPVERFVSSPTLALLATIAACVAGAYALHLFIERPLMDLGRRLSRVTLRSDSCSLEPESHNKVSTGSKWKEQVTAGAAENKRGSATLTR